MNLWRPPIVPHDLRPLIPADRLLIGEEQVHQPERAVLPAEPEDGANGPQFIGRVGVPGGGGVQPLQGVAPVALEGLAERGAREGCSPRPTGSDGDRGRCRIEVAEIGGAGEIVDVMLRHRPRVGGEQVVTELVPDGADPGGLIVMTKGAPAIAAASLSPRSAKRSSQYECIGLAE